MAENKPILFFDGHCNLCNGFVDLIIRQDKQRKIHLASLQGKTAAKLLPPSILKNLNSVVFLSADRKTFIKSSAVFQLAMVLKGSFCLIIPFWLFPRFFTDWVYDFVALNRYRLFGKTETCRIATPEEQAHFLD